MIGAASFSSWGGYLEAVLELEICADILEELATNSDIHSSPHVLVALSLLTSLFVLLAPALMPLLRLE